MNIKRVFILTVAALLLGAAVAVASDDIRIEVKSSWSGWGHNDSTLNIAHHAGRYLANGREVDSKAVKTLLAALDQRKVEQPSLEQCGITKQRLETNYKDGLGSYMQRKLTDLSPKQVALFEAHFTDPGKAQFIFSELFKGFHTDDYPEMSVKVSQGAESFGVSSRSQYPFMLPWSANDDSKGGYDCRISQAIAALLPVGFANRDRLIVGPRFRREFSERLMWTIRDEWNLLDTEFKIGPAVAPIFAQYKPRKSAITGVYSIDLEGGWGWNAELESGSLPKGLFVGVNLPYADNNLSGVDEFLAKLPQYSGLVGSVPWLSRYLEENPGTKAELRYVRGRSLSAKAEKKLTEDLREHGRNELAARVSQEAEKSAFLEMRSAPGCWMRAVVLPNKQVLLWHFSKPCQSVLGFAPGELNSWEYLDWRSAGCLVNPDGELACDKKAPAYIDSTTKEGRSE